MKLIAKGKVKGVYEAGNNELEFVFTDNISVFDKIIPSKIPHKGEVLCRISAFWFESVEKSGIKTHFKYLADGTRMRVRKVDVIKSGVDTATKNYLIPLEFITRGYNAGSLYKRILSGKIGIKALGFEDMPKYGEKLRIPLFEYTTKFESTDRLLDRREALKIGGLSSKELDSIRDACMKIDGYIERQVSNRGLIHVDGKKEFAMDEDRNIMLVDTFGTPDEDRFWDAEEYKKGNIIELSKEIVRKYYEGIGYKNALDHAREHNLKEPDIPPLPDDMIKKVSQLYIEMYTRVTGKTF